MSQPFDDSPDIPLGNNTALNHEIVRRWMSGANTRGTADILYTCVVTIVLCVWTSVHMNIPGPGEPPSRRWWRKVKWTIYGLLAPEVVLFTAWSQYNEAKDLIKYLNDQQVRHQNDKPNDIKKPLNLTYGFFAVMGGFRVPSPRLEETLTSGAIKALSCTGRFLWVDDKDIQDRSKADGLAKLLICVQVTWLSIECIARKASHLPLTILEIHTFIHVVCALAGYIIWYKKPLDIKEATVVDLSAEDKELLTLSNLLDSLKGKIFQVGDRDENSTAPRWFRFTALRNGDKVERRPATDLQLDSATILPTKLAKDEFEQEPSKKEQMEYYVLTGNDEIGLKALARVTRFVTHTDHASTFYELDWPDTITPMMRKQAYRAWTRLNVDGDMDLPAFHIRTTDRAENFDSLHDSNFSWVIEFLILIAYGGVHLAAWSSHFPTKTEMWLWRSSALLLAGTTPVLFGLGIPVIVYTIIEEVSSSMAKFLRFCFSVLAVLLVPAFVATYVFARCFLVIESFISLRSVPIGVYSAVPWSSYLPHI